MHDERVSTGPEAFVGLIDLSRALFVYQHEFLIIPCPKFSVWRYESTVVVSCIVFYVTDSKGLGCSGCCTTTLGMTE